MTQWKTSDATEIRPLGGDVFALTARRAYKGRAGETLFHAYFLKRKAGNVLFHGPDRVPFYKENAAFFDDAGGISHHLLTHGGDATRACRFLQDRWGAKVAVNRWELAEAQHRSGLKLEGLDNGVCPAEGVEAFHLPGHAVGFTMFRFEADGARWLVCGHGFSQPGTRGRTGWGGTFIPEPLKETAAKSFAQLIDLELDWLLPDRTYRDPAPPIPFKRTEREVILGPLTKA